MKAIVKSRSEPGLWLEDVPVPSIGINDVLVKVLKTGICGTDVHIYNWDAWSQKTIPVPMVVGHEYVGVVEAVGNRVQGFAPGDLVTADGHILCVHCRNCVAGRLHSCPNTNGVRGTLQGAFDEVRSTQRTDA